MLAVDMGIGQTHDDEGSAHHLAGQMGPYSWAVKAPPGYHFEDKYQDEGQRQPAERPAAVVTNGINNFEYFFQLSSVSSGKFFLCPPPGSTNPGGGQGREFTLSGSLPRYRRAKPALIMSWNAIIELYTLSMKGSVALFSA